MGGAYVKRHPRLRVLAALHRVAAAVSELMWPGAAAAVDRWRRRRQYMQYMERKEKK